MTFGTCTGNFPSIGHTIFGDLNKFLSADEVGPFKRFSTPPWTTKDDIVAVVDKLEEDEEDDDDDSCDDKILLLILDDTKLEEDEDEVDGMFALSNVCGVEVEAIGCCLFWVNILVNSPNPSAAAAVAAADDDCCWPFELSKKLINVYNWKEFNIEINKNVYRQKSLVQFLDHQLVMISQCLLLTEQKEYPILLMHYCPRQQVVVAL